MPIIDTYADRAVSGKTDRRPSWQRLMKDAEKGQFQYVLSWKSNRIGRNMLQALMNEARLNELGVCVLYTEEDFDDSAAGRFALRSMMNVNQFYSENMAEDITRGLMDNARQCKSNGSLPFGLKRGMDGRIVVDEAEAEIVREIYRRVSDYEPFADILDDLNARSIKTKRGARWNKGSFTTILHNERYRGIYIYGDVRIEGGVPRIISDPLFFKVQEVCKMKKNPQGTNRRRTGGADYLLTGKLKCGHCGRYMVGMSGTSRSGELHYYYVCQGHKEKICAKKNVRRDVIERAVARAIMMYCLTDETIEWIADQSVAYWERYDQDLQIEAMESELAESKRAAKNILKAIEAGIITEAKADEVKVDRDDLVATLRALRKGDVEDKQFQADLFRLFLICAYVYDDNRLKIVFSFTGDHNTVEIPLEAGQNDDIPENLEGAECSTKSLIAPPRDLEREFRVFFFFAARPRFQRFHDFGGYNDFHEMVLNAFRGIVGIRGNRDFVEIVGTVGFIVCAKIVETLESWDDAPSNLYGQAVFAAGVVVAAAGQEGFDQPEGERLPFFQRVAGRAAPEKAHLQPVGRLGVLGEDVQRLPRRKARDDVGGGDLLKGVVQPFHPAAGQQVLFAELLQGLRHRDEVVPRGVDGKVQHPQPLDKGPGPVAAGRVQQLGRRPLLVEDPLVHVKDAGGRLAGKLHLVGDHHHGHPLGGQPPDDRQHLPRRRGVEVGGGLVQQKDFGLHGQGAGDGHPLLLSARHLAGVFVGLFAQAHRLQQGHAPRRGLLRQQPAQPDGGQRDVFEGGQVREELEGLEHHPHPRPER